MKTRPTILIAMLLWLAVPLGLHAAPTQTHTNAIPELATLLAEFPLLPEGSETSLFSSSLSDDGVMVARRDRHRWDRRHRRKHHRRRNRRRAAGAFVGGAIIGGAIAGSAARRDRYIEHNNHYHYYNDGRYPRYYPY